MQQNTFFPLEDVTGHEDLVCKYVNFFAGLKKLLMLAEKMTLYSNVGVLILQQ